MAVCLISAHQLLANVGVNTEKVWTDFEENAVFLFPEEWEKVREYFGWSPAAKTGEYGGWKFEKIPEVIVCP